MNALSALKFASVLIMFLLLVSWFVSPIALAEVSQDQAASALATAESALASSYQAVLKAENVGANVTGLLSQLDYISGLLAQAEIAYRNGDANTAAEKANSAIPIASEVQAVADNARSTALVADQNALLSTIAFSAVGSIVFVVVLFFVWRRFKQSYFRSLLGMKPEVSD